ncbi:MAG: DUF5522 domain-containing protein [Ilumatobacteraceae bacterium]
MPELASGPSDPHYGEGSEAWRLRPDGLATALPGRLPPSERHRADVERAHDEAVLAGSAAYRDPVSGLSVFTARFLADRDYSCESGCRHSPYENSVRRSH